MDTEVIITNWGGLSGRLLNLLNSGEMFDVQLQVGGQLYDAHKLILSASSDVFKTMLTSRKWCESNKEMIKLTEEPLCETVFGRFIHYIYTGQLYLSHKTVCPMLTLADKYNVKDLIPLCQNYMLEHLDAPIHITSVLQWWTVSNLRNDKELEDKILSFIDLNFNKIIQSPDFLHSSIETVDKLLSRSKLVVHNELVIYCGVKNWIQAYMDNYNPTATMIHPMLSQLLRHIRWPMMTIDELKWLRVNLPSQGPVLANAAVPLQSLITFLVQGDRAGVESELSAVTEHYNNLCLEGSRSLPTSRHRKEITHKIIKKRSRRLGHLLLPQSQRRISEKEKNNELKCLYSPRVYTCDYWGTELKITNFAAFPKYGVQTFFFSTPRSGLSCDDGLNLDWEVELFPKGIHFPPALMIGVERDGSKLINELFVETVRLSVISRSPQEIPLKVEVNILVRANSLSEPGTTYFEQNHCRTCFFEREGQRQNFDDIVSCDNLQTYLQPDAPIPELHLLPTVAFSLLIVIRPLE